MAGVGRALVALALVTSGCSEPTVGQTTPIERPVTSPATAPSDPPERQIAGGALVRRGIAWAEPFDRERIEALYVRLATDLAQNAPSTFTGKLQNWPVVGRISSPFGPRWGGFHNGLDIAAPMLTPVLATAPGQVVAAGRPYLAYGDTAMIVIVAHAADFSTLYVHLDEGRVPPVKAGDKVAAGAVVGYVGLTGWTTGPHVHFMTVANGRAVNPVLYLP